ncbi:hypothetical protein COO59_09375 [Mixta theicola]|uniref:Uncharacterized protein n=1 Tax=Mixta theicola TaxID=1458355 RepID=A0A2K1Q9K3_9GAMM|nr:lysozyme inhibitor LprI family protein [Mixta theicola]PNS11704.1 hypothetical protein COO59_09375 [Mixta theicola]GLR07615.1 hypothetical protein GCM10007905_03340 [Mixta theicola]
MSSFIKYNIRLTMMLFLFNNTADASMPFDEGFSYCFTLPRNTVENNEFDCKTRVFEESNDALKKETEKLKAHIFKNYDNPWLLDDTEGIGIEIKDVFWQKFSSSQENWLASRNTFCSAEASLPGSWASAAGDIEISCIITMNRRRIDEIKMLYPSQDDGQKSTEKENH